MNKGLFVTFEGGEGSGKTTVVNGLTERLIKDGYEIIITREPGGCPVSEKIRGFILENDTMHPLTEAALYAASRKQHCVEVIEPALNKGAIILCDRYVHSNMVYQGYVYKGKEGIDEILQLNRDMNVCMPDITFFLDVLPETGLRRIEKNGREINRFDLKGLKFHNKVYDGYKYMQKNNMFYSIDASKKNYEDVIDDAYNQLIELLKKGN